MAGLKTIDVLRETIAATGNLVFIGQEIFKETTLWTVRREDLLYVSRCFLPKAPVPLEALGGSLGRGSSKKQHCGFFVKDLFGAFQCFMLKTPVLFEANGCSLSRSSLKKQHCGFFIKDLLGALQCFMLNISALFEALAVFIEQGFIKETAVCIAHRRLFKGCNVGNLRNRGIALIIISQAGQDIGYGYFEPSKGGGSNICLSPEPPGMSEA
ncbi:hypothetical protein CBL_20744 [Carabus blaptoides fortunei]